MKSFAWNTFYSQIEQDEIVLKYTFVVQFFWFAQNAMKCVLQDTLLWILFVVIQWTFYHAFMHGADICKRF